MNPPQHQPLNRFLLLSLLLSLFLGLPGCASAPAPASNPEEVVGAQETDSTAQAAEERARFDAAFSGFSSQLDALGELFVSTAPQSASLEAFTQRLATHLPALGQSFGETLSALAAFSDLDARRSAGKRIATRLGVFLQSWDVFANRMLETEHGEVHLGGLEMGFGMLIISILDRPNATPPRASAELPEAQLAGEIIALAKVIQQHRKATPELALRAAQGHLQGHLPQLLEQLGATFAALLSSDETEASATRVETMLDLLGPATEQLLTEVSELERRIIQSSQAQDYFSKLIFGFGLEAPHIQAVLDNMRAASGGALEAQEHLEWMLGNAMEMEEETKRYPATSACSAGGKPLGEEVPVSATDWSVEPWMSLQFQPESPHRFRYCYSVSPSGDALSILAEGSSDDSEMLNLRYCFQLHLDDESFEFQSLFQIAAKSTCAPPSTPR